MAAEGAAIGQIAGIRGLVVGRVDRDVPRRDAELGAKGRGPPLRGLRVCFRRFDVGRFQGALRPVIFEKVCVPRTFAAASVGW